MHCNELLRVYVNRKHRFSYNKIYTGLGGKEPEIPCQIHILNETESMARGTSIAMPDSALVTTTMSSACTNSMRRKLLCKTVRSDILFVYVSYWREMLVISETQIACYLFEKKTWKNNFVRLHTGINILWIFKVKNSLFFSVLYKMSLMLNKLVHKLRETFKSYQGTWKRKCLC